MERLSSGTRNWLVVVAVLIVAGVSAYFAGSAIEGAAGKRNAELAAQRYTAAKAQVDSLRAANQLLTAGLWAYRAGISLDQRNFGLANEAMANVVASLKGVDAAAAGIDAHALAAVQAEAAGVRISVAADLEAERSQVLRVATDITALVGTSGAKPAPEKGVG